MRPAARGSPGGCSAGRSRARLFPSRPSGRLIPKTLPPAPSAGLGGSSTGVLGDFAGVVQGARPLGSPDSPGSPEPALPPSRGPTALRTHAHTPPSPLRHPSLAEARKMPAGSFPPRSRSIISLGGPPPPRLSRLGKSSGQSSSPLNPQPLLSPGAQSRGSPGAIQLPAPLRCGCCTGGGGGGGKGRPSPVPPPVPGALTGGGAGRAVRGGGSSPVPPSAAASHSGRERGSLRGVAKGESLP